MRSINFNCVVSQEMENKLYTLYVQFPVDVVHKEARASIVHFKQSFLPHI